MRKDKPSELRVRRAPLIHAEIKVPGDKSISHRAAMFASLSNGVCVLHDFGPGEDCHRTVAAMRALGVQIDQPDADANTLIVHGRYRQLSAPHGDIDCGNSGTTMRLLTGLLAGQPFRSRLTGDASLSGRPMGRVIRPLTDMGARITSEGASENCAPLVIDGGALHGIDYHLPMASAQVKGAVLLAGLYASGETSVTEPSQSRDHTERLLRYFLVDVQHPEERPAEGEANKLTIEGGQMPESRNFTVPGDISSAAFWLAAAAAQPGARLLVKNVGLNDTRTGVLSVLLRMGAHVHEVVEDITQIEPTGTVEVQGARLHGTVIEGREIPNVIDEIPILAVLGTLAAGQTVIRNAAELRVKETDRLKALAANLKAMGAEVYETPDGLTITGGRPLHGARLPSYGDHRIAMAFAIAGLFAEGETIIEDCDCIDTSYPGFSETLSQILTSSTSGQPATVVISDANQFLPEAGETGSTGRKTPGTSATRFRGGFTLIFNLDQPISSTLASVLIAIDGPAASGKSTVARTLARRLGYGYVNSGALYRSATWFVLEGGLEARAAAVAAAHGFASEVEPDPSLFEGRINAHVSAVSSVPEVRAILTERLRSFAESSVGVVMEGRDIGSAVFPQTPYKFYIDASPEVRAQRRAVQTGPGTDDLLARDRTDSTRRTSPLTIAEDAHVIDSSRLTIDGVVGEIIGRLKLKGLAISGKNES